MPKRHATIHEEEPDDDGLQAPDEASLRDALLKTTDERDQLKDQLLRTMADFQNFRKRTQQEMDQTRVFATERLMTQLLPVLDNFERTIAAFESGATAESLAEGVRAIDRQLKSVLESHRLERIPAAGQAFDPQVHEAIVIAQSDDHPEGTVLAEIEAGYKMADKVIRPARVKVSKRE